VRRGGEKKKKKKKKTEAKEARLSRKAVKGKGFMQTNICDISSLHTRSPIPLALGVPNAKVGLTKTARVIFGEHKCCAWPCGLFRELTFLGKYLNPKLCCCDQSLSNVVCWTKRSENVFIVELVELN